MATAFLFDSCLRDTVELRAGDVLVFVNGDLLLFVNGVLINNVLILDGDE